STQSNELVRIRARALVVRATLVPAEPGRPHRSPCRPVCVGGCGRGWRAPEQLAFIIRWIRLDLGAAALAVLLPSVPDLPAGTEPAESRYARSRHPGPEVLARHGGGRISRRCRAVPGLRCFLPQQPARAAGGLACVDRGWPEQPLRPADAPVRP